jgi:hypothetical protein
VPITLFVLRNDILPIPFQRGTSRLRILAGRDRIPRTTALLAVQIEDQCIRSRMPPNDAGHGERIRAQLHRDNTGPFLSYTRVADACPAALVETAHIAVQNAVGRIADRFAGRRRGACDGEVVPVDMIVCRGSRDRRGRGIDLLDWVLHASFTCGESQRRHSSNSLSRKCSSPFRSRRVGSP